MRNVEAIAQARASQLIDRYRDGQADTDGESGEEMEGRERRKRSNNKHE